MEKSSRVLVVDDDAVVRELLTRLLKREGYAVKQATTAEQGWAEIQETPPDLIILDLNLPDKSGEEVCKDIRQDKRVRSIPVLILTGELKDGQTARCLDGGADDYVSKPFDNEELTARVRALLRRPRLYAAQETVLEKKQISMDLTEHRVTIKGKVIQGLSPKEFDLLYHLVLHSPKVLDKNTIALKVWGVPSEQLNSRTLDVHIRRIRLKIGTSAPCLKTIPAIGYQWLDK